MYLKIMIVSENNLNLSQNTDLTDLTSDNDLVSDIIDLISDNNDSGC